MRQSVFYSLVVIAAASLLGFGGCSKSSSTTGPPGGGGNQITISNFAYSPSPMTVAKGTTVTWKNNDATQHTATADDGSFDTGVINANATSGGVTLNTAGTFTYHCNFHSTMHGTITVQ